jgi:drug/metabolite transporter (DMT)-like permease
VRPRRPAARRHPALTSRARVALAVAAGVAAALIYAGQFVATRWSMLGTLTPWDLAAIRFGVAGPLLLPLLVRHGIRRAAGIGWGRGIVLAIAAGAPYTLILYAGLALAPAGHGAVIVTGATPIVSTLLAWLWLGERSTAARLAGLLLIVAGLVLVSWPGLAGGQGSTTWLGDLLFALDAVLWGLFTVLARHWRVDPILGTAVVWTLALAYVPFYLVTFGPRLLTAPAGELLFQALYQGVGVAILALALYAWAIRVLGAAAGSLFMPLVPVFGVLLAVPVLGEIPTAVQRIGIVGVSIGMVLATVASRPRPSPATRAVW